MRSRIFTVLAVAMLAWALLFAAMAGAQEEDPAAEGTILIEETAEEPAGEVQTGEQGVEAQGTQADGGAQKEAANNTSETTVQAQQVQPALAGVPAPPSGPLAGELVDVRHGGGVDNRIDRGDVLVIREDCRVEPGTSITVEDGNDPSSSEPNMQGTFVDGRNATIENVDGDIHIEVEHAAIGIVAVPPGSGDDVLSDRGVEVVTSEGIQCGGGDGGNGDGDDGGDGDDTGDGGGTGSGATETTTVAEATTPISGAEATTSNTEANAADLGDVDRAEGAFRCELFLRVEEGDGFDGRFGRRDFAGWHQYFDGDEDLLVQRIEECRERAVLADTIPDRNLPDTGGSPLALFAASALLVTGLGLGASVFRAGTRRRR